MDLLRKVYELCNAWREKRVRSKLCFCDDTAQINPHNMIVGAEYFIMKEYSLLQPGGTLILTGGKLILGRWSSIAYNVTIITGNHIPTVGIPHHKASMIHLNDRECDIEIGDDCWIAANVTLLPGAKLHRGCVVGTCALVNREVPPYAVVAGVPAKIVAVKFTLEQILEHEKKIYDFHERLTREYLEELFFKYYENKKPIGTDKLSAEQRRKYNDYYIKKHVEDSYIGND